MSKNIVFEGWLTKSPPNNRIWRTKWRRRWFALRQSGELPGQYFLDYYADRNYRRLKGTINLDLCEQVDAGLHMERSSNGALDPKLRGSVFTIQTQSRTYHLEADCEADMEKWVDAICRVCGLRATIDAANVLDTYQNNLTTLSTMTGSSESADTTGPYIPISECITGKRIQDTSAFSFDTKSIMMNSTMPLDRVSMNRNLQMYTSQPHIRLNNPDFSENESNLSDEECKSLNTSQSIIRDWSITKTFTNLSISPKRKGLPGPPAPPPRPPKTLNKEIFYGPKVQEPTEVHDMTSMQYYNLPSLPPVVDRALKPRHPSIGHINHLLGQTVLQLSPHEDMKTDALQYLDLDLHCGKAVPPQPQEPTPPQKKKDKAQVPQVPAYAQTHAQAETQSQGKSLSAAESDSAYKTVDFLKTEAFNITRQDAEASRSNQH